MGKRSPSVPVSPAVCGLRSPPPEGPAEPVIILELGQAPAKPLSLNEERRLHWRARCGRTDPWRDLTILMARQARLARAVAASPATVTVVIPVPDNRRRDPANYYPVTKAVIDGLVKAGVWPDDDPRYVSVTEPILTRERSASIRIELRTPAPAGAAGHVRADELLWLAFLVVLVVVGLRLLGMAL
jgi:crossover junction endodeoxyribonuclease RusA